MPGLQRDRRRRSRNASEFVMVDSPTGTPNDRNLRAAHAVALIDLYSAVSTGDMS